jgi:hypothetical protein
MPRHSTTGIVRFGLTYRYFFLLAHRVAVQPAALFPYPAYPWGSKGHEIVAAVVETQLTDTARNCIKEASSARHDVSRGIECGRTRLVTRSLIWTRTTSSTSRRTQTHTISTQRDCKLRNCVIEAIAWYLSVLGSRCTAQWQLLRCGSSLI